MAAVRSLRVSVKSDSGSESDSDSESDRDAREAEPMEVEEGELEAEDVSVNRSLKELLPDTSRRYENKAGAFITGIDVNSKEAIERKEKRARRFHFRCEENVGQRNVLLDKDAMKKAIPRLRMEAIHVTGVDDMSTQDVFGYFKEYPPAHIEWINDTACNVVWLDDDTCIRALINSSRMPCSEAAATQTESGSRPDDPSKGEWVQTLLPAAAVHSGSDSGVSQVDDLSRAERESLLRNELRPVIRPFKGNKLRLRFATLDDRKELGAARRSRYYMKYGNPNYGGMKGILSNSWKRRFHTRRIQRDVIKSKKPLIGDSMGHTPPYTHRHSADLVNLPEEPIKEEEEEDEEEDDEADEDMEEDDRVVEYKEKGGGPRPLGAGLRARMERSPSPWSESDEMDYDLELKMISTPSPKKSKKMTMYADEIEGHLKNIRSRMVLDPGGGSSSTVIQSWPGKGGASSPPKVTDVRQLLEEKRQGGSQRRQRSPVAGGGKTGELEQNRAGQREHPAPWDQASESSLLSRLISICSDGRLSRRLFFILWPRRSCFCLIMAPQTFCALWSRLGSGVGDDSSVGRHDRRSGERSARHDVSKSRRGDGEEEEEEEEREEEDDSTLQKVWGAMIKQKQERRGHKIKKSRLDNLPSLQIEISRDSSDDSDA
uniref:Nuclear cap-binding protein subunit 3 n=1 Tax=Fundulus heteroclitus TaxID=8078 RepID=A0A3Q2QAP5_FUNHE